MSRGADLDLELVARIDAHSVDAWPPTVRESGPGGWVFRATPGLDRGRSNNALTPARRLEREEIRAALERVRSFADRHGVPAGIQVSPSDLHELLLSELDAQGWTVKMPVLVMAGERERLIGLAGEPALDLVVSPQAEAEWLAAWEVCEPGHDVEAHVQTVFPELAGRAMFARYGSDAVGIAVEGEGLAGLFCLAVAPGLRGQGIGGALVRGLLRRCTAPLVYLQVQEDNRAARRLYDRLGFELAYSYRHYVAP